MCSALSRLRGHVRTTADAIRWACLLDATAPKAGNVYPGCPFADLTYAHFVTAAEITALLTLSRLNSKTQFLVIADRYTNEIQQARRFEKNWRPGATPLSKWPTVPR